MLVQFAFGVIEIDPVSGEIIGDEFASGRYCNNCMEEVHTPDDRTGLIHVHGKYRCFTYTDTGKPVPLSTVAE